jgi:hypothetical protein
MFTSSKWIAGQFLSFSNDLNRTWNVKLKIAGTRTTDSNIPIEWLSDYGGKDDFSPLFLSRIWVIDK